MLKQHFPYLSHAHICSRKISRRTWIKVFVKKSIFLKLLSRKFWLFKSLKNKILRLSEQLLTNYVSHDPNFFLPLDRAMLEQHLSYLGHDHICSRKFSGRTWKNFSSKNSYFSDFSIQFWVFKTLKNKILRQSDQLLTSCMSHDPDIFSVT